MKIAEAKKAIKNIFSEKLNSHNYSFQSGTQGGVFIKNYSNTYYRIIFAVSNWHFYYMSGIRASLGINKITKLELHLMGEGLADIITISIADDDYMNELNFRYRIENEEDLEKYSIFVDKFLKECAFPFFEKYSNIDAIDKHMNNDPEDTMPKYCYDMAKKITSGLIAAKLNNNPKYNELRDNYKEKVERFLKGYFNYEPCMKVINFLDSYTSEELNRFTDDL